MNHLNEKPDAHCRLAREANACCKGTVHTAFVSCWGCKNGERIHGDAGIVDCKIHDCYHSVEILRQCKDFKQRIW